MTSLSVNVFYQFARSFSLVQMTRYRATDTANIENGHPLKAWYIITCRTRDRSMGSLTIPDLDEFFVRFFQVQMKILAVWAKWMTWQVLLWHLGFMCWGELYPPAQPKSQRYPFFVCKRVSCIPKCGSHVHHMCTWSCKLQANGLDFELAEKPTSAENVDIGYSRNSKFVDSRPQSGLMFLVLNPS